MMKNAILPPGYRRGAPRVGDTIVVEVAGETRETTVTQVLGRIVKSNGFSTFVHGVKTSSLGFSGYGRGAMDYLIKEC
jgi:hypothetical protein